MKIYFKYIALAIVSLLFNIFVYITSPLWALIAALFNINKLPGILSWVHTQDNDIYGQPDMPPAPTNFKERFKTAVWWLCRNPGYGFDSRVLGFKSSDITSQVLVKEFGSFNSGKTAVRYDTISVKGKKYFSYRRDQSLGRGRYIKMWFGWHNGLDQNGYRMLKIAFNPFKKLK